MGLRKLRPITPGQRYRLAPDFSEISKKQMIDEWKSLNSQGRYAKYLLHPNSTHLFKNLLTSNSIVNTVVRARMRALPCFYYLHRRFPNKFNDICQRCKSHTESQRHIFQHCEYDQDDLKKLNHSIAMILKKHSNGSYLEFHLWYDSWFSQYRFNIETGEVIKRTNMTERKWSQKEALITGGVNNYALSIFDKLNINKKTQIKMQRIIERYIQDIWLKRCKDTFG